MPTYDYRCDKEHMTELRISMMDETPKSTPCTECGDVAKRLFNAPVVEFRGTGFYANDKKQPKGE